MTTIEIVKKNFQTIKNFFDKNSEFYTILFSILLLYSGPYLFLSSFTVLSIYKVYKNIKVEFEIDIKILNNNETIIILDNKKED